MEVELPIECERFRLPGSVTRCDDDPSGHGWRVGVVFDGADERFRAKLAEQVVRIHELRRELSRLRGEEVSTEQAAAEWVEHYAEEFAELYEA